MGVAWMEIVHEGRSLVFSVLGIEMVGMAISLVGVATCWAGALYLVVMGTAKGHIVVGVAVSHVSEPCC